MKKAEMIEILRQEELERWNFLMLVEETLGTDSDNYKECLSVWTTIYMLLRKLDIPKISNGRK